MSDRSHSISDAFCVTNRFAQSTKETVDLSSARVIPIGTHLTGCLRGINSGLCCWEPLIDPLYRDKWNETWQSARTA